LTNDGKRLEDLVSSIEKQFLGTGYKVVPRKRIYNENGVQIAEFDLDIRGRVGTTDFAWLVECRDRPSEGPAPGSWIRDIANKRDLNKFDRATAVSTTGFSPGAENDARQLRVELREVRALEFGQFTDWLKVETAKSAQRKTFLHHANVILTPGQEGALVSEASDLLANSNGDTPLLRAGNRELSLSQFFNFCVNQAEGAFDTVQPNGPAKPVTLNVQIDQSKGSLLLTTSSGAVSVQTVNGVATSFRCCRSAV